ncbi:S9 family peptidase [Lysobacter korlensis]|uniref:S9 family peptidase n=1 Tax=Lysobacter korlensis TaxID=553636 RepID=A0ABV6RTF6_9GAMM
MTQHPIADGLDPDELQVHRDAWEWFTAVEGPGLGRVSTGSDPAVTPEGGILAFTAGRRVSLDSGRHTTIALLDTASGELRTIGEGCHDRLPRWSPDGTRLAYLSDRAKKHVQQVVWTAPGDPELLTHGPQLQGVPEHLEWSPAGDRLLVTVREEESATRPGAPSWWPKVDRPAAPAGWRQLQVIDVASGAARRISAPGWTVWEAVWAGPEIVAIVSTAPGEEAWYRAQLVRFDVGAGDAGPVEPRALHTSDVHLGRPSASPAGSRVAVVEAFSSDRSLVAGDLVLLEGGSPGRRLDTLGTDVAHSAWRSDDVLFFAGVRGQQTVAGEIDLETGAARELWVSDGSTSGVYPQAVQDAAGTIYALAESYRRAPHAVAVRDGEERMLADLSHAGSEHLLAQAGDIRRVHWTGADGLPLDGFLVTPPAEVATAPYPVVFDIHGGPVWTWHDQYAMRGSTGPFLASRGYAVLYVNQRGGTGKGQEFARLIAGDMHGADTGDFLTAVDALAGEGLIDVKRVGLTGTSYGGTMALWLPTQDQRFAAVVAVSGLTDWVSFHHTTWISDFDLFFLPGKPLDPNGEYIRRSPLMHSARIETPVLMITGALDRDVPPSQSLELHRALTMRGAVSELVTYPEEGHVVGDFPAVVDFVARHVAWFERHMPPDLRRTGSAS